MAKPRKPNRRRPNTTWAAEFSTDVRIVLVDQEPVRAAVIQESRRLMRSLQEARLELHEYETVSRVAYDRWMASTFGGLLTRRRELGEAIAKADDLINEVHLLVMLHGGSLRAAYRRLMREREAQARAFEFAADDRSAPDETEEAGAYSQPEEEGDSREAMEKAMFEESLRMILGMEPRSLPKAEYDRLYRDFRRTFFGSEDRQQSSSRKERRKTEAETAKGPEPGVRRKLKELYRMLVRRLHPDVRADADPTVSALWHEVQEAYGRGDEERLETLLAVCEVQADAITTGTSLSQLLAVRADLKRDLNAILRALRRCRKEPGWKFSEKNVERLGETIRRTLESQIHRLAGELAEMERMIESWQSAPRKRSGRAPAAKKRRAPSARNLVEE